ncbi:hypothetical protein [Massilia sp. Leaf139]|uniref:hypothetical protein n=1 Tax=Massilia sp. Leaf139 TaxID=1736272 RepID=UPI0006F558D8|nr:hypothetical protein [Massilia sp. Leaf139]KQQ96232.1 hypothetical protein ASF77_21125 [Massilia sp. Leaf139]
MDFARSLSGHFFWCIGSKSHHPFARSRYFFVRREQATEIESVSIPLSYPIHTVHITNILVVLAVLVSSAGVAIHLGALVAGLSWLVFFNAPASVVDSYKAGTWFAPVSCVVIAALMATCGYYAASVLGWVRRPPLQRLGLATMAAICMIRALLLPILAVSNPELRNTFEIVAAAVWGLAGIGFMAAFVLARARREQSGILPSLDAA